MFTKNNESMKRTENNNSVVNIIGQGTSIFGDINSNGDIRIDGTLKGSIKN